VLIVQTIGNSALWQREKTLFLTSKMAPFECYEKVFGWVDSLSSADTVVCFSSSELEYEIVKALLVNHVPTILVVMDYFHDRYNVQIERALKENRLMIMVLKREKTDGRGTTPYLRNKYIMSQVQHTVCGYVNPKGSIFLLLGGTKDVTYLLKDDALIAAESTSRPLRWTVAEDKCLLRMFYEDMGIHAIHKAIGRPYSTVYNRIKAITMNDEVLKGRQFEDFFVGSLDLQHDDRLFLKEWRGDKSLPGIYPVGNSAPDFLFEYDGHPFAVECKWRNHMPKEIAKELLPADRQAFYLQYAREHNIPVYLLLGIGGLPSEPDSMYFVSLMEPITYSSIIQKLITNAKDIIPLLSFSATEPDQTTGPDATNANKPWTEADDLLLAELHKDGRPIEELMEVFKRPRRSIRYRLRKLGLTV